MSLKWFLVSKYLRFDKSQPFITVSALLAFFGVGIGVMVLLIAMAIMNGFDKEFQRKLFTMNYPLTVTSYKHGGVTADDILQLSQKLPHLAQSPYISTQVMLRRGQRLEGGVIFGVNAEDEKRINSVFAEAIGEKSLNGFEIVVGRSIKEQFLLELGDKLMLLFTQIEAGGLSLTPKMKRFDFVSDFSSGLNAYDKAYMYTSIEALTTLLNYKSGFYDGVHIYSDDAFNDLEKIKNILPSHLRVIGWWQQNGNFFSALELEKRALMIVLMLIILVASLNIISSLLMTVMNRRQEIALLLSLGVEKKLIKQTFFTLGSVIGGSGVIFGIVLGLLGIVVLGSFDIINLPADVYGSSKLPMELSLIDFGSIVVGATLIVLFSSYYPAKKATQIDVLETLRNE